MWINVKLWIRRLVKAQAVLKVIGSCGESWSHTPWRDVTYKRWRCLVSFRISCSPAKCSKSTWQWFAKSSEDLQRDEACCLDSCTQLPDICLCRILPRNKSLHHVSDMLNWAYIRWTDWPHNLLKLFRMLLNTNSPNPIFELLPSWTMPWFSGVAQNLNLAMNPKQAEPSLIWPPHTSSWVGLERSHVQLMWCSQWHPSGCFALIYHGT